MTEIDSVIQEIIERLKIQLNHSGDLQYLIDNGSNIDVIVNLWACTNGFRHSAYLTEDGSYTEVIDYIDNNGFQIYHLDYSGMGTVYVVKPIFKENT